MHRVAVLVLLFTSPALAQAPGNLWPEFGKGKTGDFRHSKDRLYQIKVVEVIDDTTMLCKLGSKPPFLVTKHKLKCIVDDATIELEGEWKCTGTKKHDGATRWVIEPAP